MSKSVHLRTPLTEKAARSLRAGDTVLLSGIVYAARDAAHKRMMAASEQGEALPINLKDQIIYYVGPAPAKENQPIGSAGPTTSSRMDLYTPCLIEHGLRGMIGKGYRSPAVIEAMKKFGTVYFVATGGAAALLAEKITAYELVAYPDLGPEAVAKLTINDFPVIVAIDCEGHNFYEIGQKKFNALI
jgi:fumarate hydratase subunit beta